MELHAVAINQLRANAARVEALVNDVVEAAAHWKPSADSWSIVEVINHLADEEEADFPVRLDIILHRPHDPWPPIDPQGWVVARDYNSRALQPSLRRFLTARARAVAWLADLADADWDTVAPAPWGKIRAGDMLTAWAAHDLLHLRQLVEIQWAWLERESAPYVTLYAGEW